MSLGMDVLHVPGATGDSSALAHLRLPAQPPFDGNMMPSTTILGAFIIQRAQLIAGPMACKAAARTISHFAVAELHNAHLSGKECDSCAGDYQTQFHAKSEAIAEALISGKYDFGFLHIKAIDDTGHDRAACLKVTAVDLLDKHASGTRVLLLCLY